MKCVNISLFYNVKQGTPTPDPIAQSVSSLTADAGGASSILVRSHTLIETNREIVSTVIFLLLLFFTYKRTYVYAKLASLHVPKKSMARGNI